jgi:hypothetical protein
MTDPTAPPDSSMTAAGLARGSATTQPALDDEISLWEVLAVLLRRRGTIVLTTIVVAGAAAAFAQFRALTYTTAASFRPQGSQASGGQLMALASQFGVAVPGGGTEEASPAFYAELLTSRELLHRAATRPYEVDGFGAVLLKDLLEIDEATEPERDEKVYEWLRDEAVSVSTGRETGSQNSSSVSSLGSTRTHASLKPPPSAPSSNRGSSRRGRSSRPRKTHSASSSRPIVSMRTRPCSASARRR